MATTEEILLKLGLDAQSFSNGVQNIKQKLQGFSEEGHKSFIHASNGAREFHKVIHQLTEQSPLLGTALQAAISPIGGALIGATLGFTYFQEKLKEWNKEMDEASTEAAK